MAIVTKDIAEIRDRTCWVEVDYNDTNELIQAIRWENHTGGSVLATVRQTRDGIQVLQTTLANGQTGSASFSGTNRFKLDEYSVSLAYAG